MSDVEFSIYSSAFNLIKNGFNYHDALKNFCSFADEVVISVNKSEDDTMTELAKCQSTYKNLVLVSCDISYSDPLLDGKIKNEALQATSKNIKIGLDLDERVPLRHKSKFIELASQLLNDNVDCYMIPSIDLYGSYETVKADSSVFNAKKWYMHKGGLKRGPVIWATNSDGTVDTSKSDTCELIYDNGHLTTYKAISIPFEEHMGWHDLYFRGLEYLGTFVYHLGYADFDERVRRNKNFWYNHWRVESGGKEPDHKVHMDISEFDKNAVEHKLLLWDA